MMEASPRPSATPLPSVERESDETGRRPRGEASTRPATAPPLHVVARELGGEVLGWCRSRMAERVDATEHLTPAFGHPSPRRGEGIRSACYVDFAASGVT